METEKIIQAGKIAKEVREYAREIVKPGISLLELAGKIEEKIVNLGGKPAFPVNLSMNNIAAHYTPDYNDDSIARGLLKVDFGVHIDGWVADNAFSVDLEGSEENKNLIESSERAIEDALKIIRKDVSTDEIGEAISKAIESRGFSPVINLTGHGMDQFELHTGIGIPNVNDGRDSKMSDGLYAVEPFATNGGRRVRDGKPSGIYELKSDKNIRSLIARDILDFVEEEYDTLPFCSRWIVKKFGTKALFGLRQLEENGNLHQFAQLVEVSNDAGTKVAQTEHTVLIDKGKVTVVTL
ncbi:MAG: type II methionyl aminopeptidase [Nanoarchaeota archaeon]|nr:type II methionyl aminopeptidase [Nanoarchaeota archaeon]